MGKKLLDFLVAKDCAFGRLVASRTLKCNLTKLADDLVQCPCITGLHPVPDKCPKMSK